MSLYVLAARSSPLREIATETAAVEAELELEKSAQGDHAFAFLVTSFSYDCMTRVAVRSLRFTGAAEQIVVMTTIPFAIEEKGVRVLSIPKPRMRGVGRWEDTFAKLSIARLPYKRVVFFDSDIYFYRNPSFLFEVNPRDSVAGPEAYWLPNAPIATGGPLIVNPSPNLFSDVLDDHLAENFEGEMDYVISRFNRTAQILPFHVSILVSEFIPSTPLYKMRGGRPTAYMIIHFDGGWKPSLVSLGEMKAQYPHNTDLLQIYTDWFELQKLAC